MLWGFRERGSPAAVRRRRAEARDRRGGAGKLLPTLAIGRHGAGDRLVRARRQPVLTAGLETRGLPAALTEAMVALGVGLGAIAALAVWGEVLAVGAG
ncbi:hypothetical protein D7D52_25495 [Nocardia yunnanensis]|uniref:Uncharacterized protein n=1 Tax=Nocardia yunnanensis TaxID=2382165 RepID=A0A386ZHM2_9NOCA|nr:hypothetical protein D7D52_25495 [Nocardia yunnanensis]